MKVTIETINPKQAEDLLVVNKINRKLYENVVAAYAADMSDKRWTDCPEPISFYADGTLADGQHRLWAIVISGITQTFIIVRGLPLEAGLNINTGRPRTLVDNARISGADPTMSVEMAAVARAVEEGTRSGARMTNSQRLTIVNCHRVSVEWAMHNGPRGRGVRNSIVLAAIARACVHEKNLERLKEFGEVLTTGIMDGPADVAAVAIRNYLLLQVKEGSLAASPKVWRDLFLKVQNSIHYFMRGRRLVVIKSVKDEAYPLIWSVAKSKAAAAKPVKELPA